MNAPVNPLRWPVRERRLSLAEVLDCLALEKIAAPELTDKLKAEWRLKKNAHHPLVLVADQKWKSLLDGKT